MTTSDSLQYYARHDPLTHPAGLAPLYDELPAAPAALCAVLSGLIVHTSWARAYGIPDETPLPRDTKPVAERLAEIKQRFDGPLVAFRPPMQRPLGTCRDFALLLCSALRHRSIPARVRCGFATYFADRRYTDHWICEYWLADERRWAMADAQIDQIQRDHLAIEFNSADVPTGAFLTASSAWKLARSGAIDADEFGHGDVGGLWFVSVDLHRDLLALANCHVSAWDTWRSADEASKELSNQELTACDRLADVVTATVRSGDMSEVRVLATRLRVPPWQRTPAALEHLVCSQTRNKTVHLYVANKLYSSWSLRPWLLMTALDIPFEETVIPMYFPDSKARMLDVSPTGKMPVLIVPPSDMPSNGSAISGSCGGSHQVIWESLAIIEFLHERFPEKGVWPRVPAARAHARATASEMHAGFQALRQMCPMNLGKRFAPKELSSDVSDNVRRLEGMWSDCRRRFAAGGDFLFGDFCAADAMYAPVVTRLDTYQVPVATETRQYMNRVLAHPAFVKWRTGALAEPWAIDHYEEGWTAVETFHTGEQHTEHPRHLA